MAKRKVFIIEIREIKEVGPSGGWNPERTLREAGAEWWRGTAMTVTVRSSSWERGGKPVCWREFREGKEGRVAREVACTLNRTTGTCDTEGACCHRWPCFPSARGEGRTFSGR